MSAIYNFSPGPAALPDDVLTQVRDELLDWQSTGLSVMEVSHRGKDFINNVVEESEQDLRDLLDIPSDYSVLFLHGGAQAQFAAIPMNLLGDKHKAAYVQTGIWSEKSIKEAKRYCDVDVVVSAKDSNYTTIPEAATWKIPDDAAYLYYVDNETVNGVEFPSTPQCPEALPLFSDMSSNILSRPVDVSRHGLIFACAQKNMGPAGVTAVIVRNDLLQREPLAHTPSILRYGLQAKEKSLLNTAPVFSWYVCGLVFKWVKKQGGVAVMAERNQKKANKLYQFVDQSGFYNNPIDPHYRSRMNVIFTLSDESLNDAFLQGAAKNGLANLKGHRLLGGMRASIYNAMPESGVDALLSYMKDFEKQYG